MKELMKERWQWNTKGDYCYIDWMSLTLKMSEKSPKHPDFVPPEASSNDTVSDRFDGKTNSHSNATLNGSNDSQESGN